MTNFASFSQRRAVVMTEHDADLVLGPRLLESGPQPGELILGHSPVGSCDLVAGVQSERADMCAEIGHPVGLLRRDVVLGEAMADRSGCRRESRCACMNSTESNSLRSASAVTDLIPDCTPWLLRSACRNWLTGLRFGDQPPRKFAANGCQTAALRSPTAQRQRVVDGQGPEEGGKSWLPYTAYQGQQSPPDSTVWLTADCSMPGICGKPWAPRIVGRVLRVVGEHRFVPHLHTLVNPGLPEFGVTGTPSSRSMYHCSSSCEIMSALSPVLAAASMGAPVSGLSCAARIAWTIAAPTLTVSVSCGRKLPAHNDSLCPHHHIEAGWRLGIDDVDR